MQTATLDACILYKGTLTDLLLWIASYGLFSPTWSDEIHDEWCRNLVNRLPSDRIEYRRSQMDNAFKSAKIPANADLILTIQGKCRTAAERKDAHVIATAVDGQADVIVTANIRDFRTKVLEEYGLTKQRPDAFLVELLNAHQTEVLAGVRAHRASLKRTNPTVTTFLAELAGPKADLPRFAQALKEHEAQI